MFIPKKILYGLGGLGILLVGIFLGSLGNKAETNLLPAQSTGQAALGNLGSPSTNFATTSTSSSELAKVTRVVDGDTINVEINGQVETVRYIGIDTPETVDPRKPVQCFGVEASKKNKELVEGKMVRLERDITERDKYNRLLRYIWLDEVLINRELVVQGFAKSYSYPPDIKYQNKMVEAEKEARENKRGLWSACPAGTSSSVAPAAPSQSSSASAPNSSCTIKGNINAQGEKIYHLLGCGSYSKTTIDESRGEKWFCSESEAQSAGWRKAGNCN